MNNKINIIEKINSIEKPKDMNIETELAWALNRVLNWSNPGGRIRETYIPKWLEELANDAINRYLQNKIEMDLEWLCPCGLYIIDGSACPMCGREPPWE